MKLENVASILEAAQVARLGDDLYIGMLPSKADRGLLLRMPPTGTLVNNELSGYYKGEFQLIARAPDYLDALALIKQAVAALKKTNETWDGVLYQYMRPINLPVSFPISGGSLIEFSVRMAACYVDLAESAR